MYFPLFWLVCIEQGYWVQMSDQTTQPEAAHNAVRVETRDDAVSSPKRASCRTALAVAAAPVPKGKGVNKKAAKKLVGGKPQIGVSASKVGDAANIWN